MKRSFFPCALGGTVLAVLLAAPVQAADISYDGTTPADLQILTDNYGISWANNVLVRAGSGGTPAVFSKTPLVHRSNEITPVNSVTLLTGGAVDWVFGAVNYRDAAAVSDNRVLLTGGTVSNGVYGADHWLQNGDTQAANNRVAVCGGTVGSVVVGGQAQSDASGNARASASGNAVIVSGGAMTRIEGGDAWNDSSGSASAINNTVDIQGGTITDTVYGGYAYSEAGTAVATNNTVKISAAPPVLNLAGAWLYGGFADTDSGATQSTGNTLQIATAAGVTVFGLSDFQKLNFTLNVPLAPGAAILTVANAVDFGADAQISVSAHGVAMQPGDTFTLIDASSARLTGNVATPAPGSTLNGYAYTLAITANKLVLTVGAPVFTAAAAPALNPATPDPAELTGLTCQRKDAERWASSV